MTRIPRASEGVEEPAVSFPIYLDYNATTPLDARVLEAMQPALTQHFGNPASHTHAHGWAAAKLVEMARGKLADVLGTRPEELVFTSGATEANNLAIKGAALAAPASRRHLVTVATEHKAVLDPCQRLARDGFSVTVVSVDGHGRVSADDVIAALAPETLLVSVMLANNETGTLQPLAEIAAACRQRGVLVHTDATQAVGKIPVDATSLGVDLLSCSGHKVYGPKGVGALYVRRDARRRLVPQLDGGGHEQGLRSGTLNVPGIVGFGRAVELCAEVMSEESKRIGRLRDALRARLLAALPGVEENGHPYERLPNTLNLSFVGVDGGALLASLREVAVASGSACTSADPSPSHVLLAMGRSRRLANASLRFSLGRPTTEAEIDAAAAAVIREVTRLRADSPLWAAAGTRR